MTDPLGIDYRSNEEKAVEMMSHVCRAKVMAIIEQGFEAWEGTAESYGYELEISIKCTTRP